MTVEKLKDELRLWAAQVQHTDHVAFALRGLGDLVEARREQQRAESLRETMRSVEALAAARGEVVNG